MTAVARAMSRSRSLVRRHGMNRAMPAPSTGYIAANGVEYYYEIHGRGDPRLLLNGGHGTLQMVR